ncbi:MAG: PAS domain S-box protein [Anaerolineales bacterium]
MMNTDELRAQAEAILKDQTLPEHVKLAQVQDLMHELQVYQVELELQNDVLQDAQASIEALRQQYFDLYHFAPVGYLVIDGHSVIKDLNLTACDMLGYDKRHLMGRALANFCHVDARPDFLQMLGDAFDTHTAHQADIRLTHEPALYVHMAAQVYETQNNFLCRLTLTDITPRVRAEAELSASEERFRRAIIDAPQPIMLHAEDGEILLISRAWTELTGYGLRDIPTTDAWVKRAHPGNEVTMRGLIMRLYALEQREDEGAFTIRTRDGSQQVWQFSSSPLGRLPDGRRLVISMATDITARVQAETDLKQLTEELEQRVQERTAQLRESEAFLQSVTDAQPTMIVVLDDAGRVISANERWRAHARAHGTDPAKVEGTGQNYADLIQTWNETPGAERLQALLKGTSDVVRYEYVCTTGTEPRWYEVTMTLFQRAEQRHIIVSHSDVTEHKHLETDIQRNLESERELNQMKTQFVSMVSHEFRNPLAAILSTVELLDHYADRLDETQRAQKFEAVREHVQRLTTLLDEVSYINKFEVVDYQPNLQAADLTLLLAHLARSAQQDTPSGASLVLDMPPTLPGQFDKGLIERIFYNLIANALKYSRGQGEVTVVARIEGQEAVVDVADQGIGIPTEDQKYIFYEPFHRGRNVDKLPGTGLGLTIVKQCVDKHGGQIQFESREGVGTTFTVCLPLGPR